MWDKKIETQCTLSRPTERANHAPGTADLQIFLSTIFLSCSFDPVRTIPPRRASRTPLKGVKKVSGTVSCQATAVSLVFWQGKPETSAGRRAVASRSQPQRRKRFLTRMSQSGVKVCEVDGCE
jgi:hypothetical protein